MTNLSEKLTALQAQLRPSGEPKVKTWPKSAQILELRLPPAWPPQNDAPASDASQAAIAWCLRQDNALLQQGQTQDLAQLAALAAGNRVLLWSPTAETLMTEVQLPTRKRSKILQALPYSLEEQLVDSPENQHYVYYPLSEGRLAVAVTHHQRMQAWLDTLHAAGIKPSIMCPAAFALPHTQDTWALAFASSANTETHAWVRRSRYQGFACHASAAGPDPLLSLALREARAKEQAPTTLLVFQAPADFDSSAWSQALDLNVMPETQDLWHSQITSIPDVNLLQGPYTAQIKYGNKYAPLRPAAVLLLLWLISSLAADIWQWQQLRSAYHHTQDQIIQVFRSAFPEIKAIHQPALLMQRQLEALQASSGGFGNQDFLALLALTAPALKTQTQLQLDNLKYNDNGLVLGLQLPNFQALESLKNQLTTAGAQIEVLSATSGSGGVSSRIKVSRGDNTAREG